MQVDPGYPVVFTVDPTLAFKDFQLLKLKCDKLLSNFARFGFNCNLRHYSKAEGTEIPALREFVHERTLQRRRVTIRRHVEALLRFGDQVGGGAG